MAAVVRVKRPLTEEPAEILVLNCKRRKVDAEEHVSVLKLATTTKNPTLENITSNDIKKLSSEFKAEFKKHSVNLAEKLRAQKLEDSKNSRYKVVNCYRTQKNQSSEVEDYQVIELETDNVEPKSEYVYDLYYTSSDDLGEADVNDYLDVYSLQDNLYFGPIREPQLESDYDSEDSNAESYWKNDYPDEDDFDENSINSDDMVKAMQNMDLENDLSSDEDTNFCYSIDADDLQLDQDDIANHGLPYAKFKAKHLKILKKTEEEDFYYGETDDEQ